MVPLQAAPDFVRPTWPRRRRSLLWSQWLLPCARSFRFSFSARASLRA